MALTFTIIPVLTTLIGALLALWRRPGPLFKAGVQHLAAGVVFATAAAELLPDILHEASPLTTFIGGAAGVLAMLAIRKVEELVEGPLGMITTVGVDILVDGLVLGIGLATDLRTAILLTIALSLEVLLLGLTSVLALETVIRSVGRRFLIICGLALLLPVGVLMATPVAALPEQARLGLLTFGLVALLFLVTEELLVEAHETEERSWVTALFFAGFLGLMLADELMR